MPLLEDRTAGGAYAALSDAKENAGQIASDGNPDKQLNAESFTPVGDLVGLDDNLAMAVGSARRAEAWVQTKQWNLLWRDTDFLYQSPRPMTVYENTYVLEPNVQRFTVAKVVNAIVPQLYKGLFYENPPMILRPRPGTTQDVTDGKKALFSYLLDACKFKRETKWGLEQMATFGTGVWKWGVNYEKVERKKRISTAIKANAGDAVAQDPDPTKHLVYSDAEPKVTTESRVEARPFFEWRPIARVLVDPHTSVGDIREAKWVIDVRYMDFYEMQELQENLTNAQGEVANGWNFPEKMKEAWINTSPSGMAPTKLASEQSAEVRGIVHHAEDFNSTYSSDPLRNKLEVLEYWDAKRKIVILNRCKVLYGGENKFKKVPFLSANWWNRPRAFYGMGLGLIVGQNQRVDQGTINAILKILSFGVNPIYLRRRDSNSPTQMIRTGLGKILTVDGEVANAYHLLETPKVPQEIWAALQESERATESASGADQMLVQGSTAGPRTSMGRTAGGAATLAGASATRLDGPMDNFIEQVFTPFLYILNDLVYEYMSDKEIMDILGDELGQEYRLDLQKFHDGRHEFEVLAGASLAAKRVMAQSLTLITQIFENPNVQQNLAEINEEYIDFKPILNMWMEASEWKNKADIIKKLTPAMKAKMAEKSQAAQQNSQLNQKMMLQDRQFQQKQQYEDQANQNRIQRDMVREAFRANSMSEASQGEPSATGLGGI